MTIEQQIDKRVEERLNELLPQITEKLRQELIFKQTNQTEFTQKQLADRWGMHPSTLWKWRQEGLPCHGKKPTFYLAEAEKWKRENK